MKIKPLGDHVVVTILKEEQVTASGILLPDTVDKEKKAQGKITSALVGFIIIFLAYWLTQALEIIFGIQIFPK